MNCRDLMEKTITHIDQEPERMYVYLKEFTDELKAYEQKEGKNKRKREPSPGAGDLAEKAKQQKIDTDPKQPASASKAAPKSHDRAKDKAEVDPDVTQPSEKPHEGKEVTDTNHTESKSLETGIPSKPDPVQPSEGKKDAGLPEKRNGAVLSERNGHKDEEGTEKRSKEKESKRPDQVVPSTSSDSTAEQQDGDKPVRGSVKQIMKLEKLLKVSSVVCQYS